MSHRRIISVIGLGYVGLPVAAAFASGGAQVVAFDIDAERIAELKRGIDRTREVAPEVLRSPGLSFTDRETDLRRADFHIVTVPTPVDAANRPDFRSLLAASRTIGRQLKRGDIVVYESTVYPGATEEDCVPVLEQESGLKSGADFFVGYSPERINPGDTEHRFDTIRKVVSAGDRATLDIMTEVYNSVVKPGVFRAASIRAAEAAKVIENTQRDINIAMINELAMIFDRLGIDTRDVLEAAGTKWNFLPFRPGLVGGHCVGVDPFYLTYKAESVGYHPQVILAGRRVNDGMGIYIANQVVRNLMQSGWNGRPLVTILGVTFKENVPDFRNTRVADIVRELGNFGIEAQVHDPLADPDRLRHEYGLRLLPLEELKPADAVVLAVAHREYRSQGWDLIGRLLRPGGGFVVDVPALLPREKLPQGVRLWRL